MKVFIVSWFCILKFVLGNVWVIILCNFLVLLLDCFILVRLLGIVEGVFLIKLFSEVFMYVWICNWLLKCCVSS